MSFKLSCVAIVIAVACIIQMGYAGKTTKSERSKRALYYQNDLLSNQERQLRAQFPLGLPAYDYGVLPVYDYLYYDYLDPLYPVYPIYPIYDYLYPDYYDYLYPDYVFPLSAKSPAGQAAAAPPNAAARPLSGRRQSANPLAHHIAGHPQAAQFMNAEHMRQHNQFGGHAPHSFGHPAGVPSASHFGAPPAPNAGYLPGPQNLQNRNAQFQAIKLASSKGGARNVPQK